MTAILIQKILSLSLVMAAGFLLVRFGPLGPEDSRSLSRLTVYLVMPCSIFSAFQTERTPQVLQWLGLVLLAAVLIHLGMMALTVLIRRPFHLNGVEQASVIYTNAGNLVIPLVTAVLGPEWVIYTSAYILVMTVLTWSHGKALLCGERSVDVPALLKNPNILALTAGCLLFLLNIRLPKVLGDTLSTVGSMVGPLSMLVTGMLIGTMTAKETLGNKRVWLVALLRLAVYPAFCVGLLALLGQIFPQSRGCLLVTLMSAAAPTASLVTHICQLHGEDSGYASAICVVNTLLCALSIPLAVTAYLAICPL